MNKLHNCEIAYPEIVYRYTVGKLPYMRIDNKLEPIFQPEYEWFSEMLQNKSFDLSINEYSMIHKYFIERESIKEISSVLDISYSKCRYVFERLFYKLRREIGSHRALMKGVKE